MIAVAIIYTDRKAIAKSVYEGLSKRTSPYKVWLQIYDLFFT